MRVLGSAILAGLMMTGFAQAQPVLRVGPGVVVASDLYYDDGPPRYAPPPYARAYPPPPPAHLPYHYNSLPVHEVYRVVRENGFSPLGAPVNRGNVITISVFDPDGVDGRLVIDAVTGRILRFVPAYGPTGNVRNVPAVPVAYGAPPVPLPKPRTTAKPAVNTVLSPQIPPAPAAALAAAQPSSAALPPAPKPSFAPQPTQTMPPVQGAE